MKKIRVEFTFTDDEWKDMLEHLESKESIKIALCEYALNGMGLYMDTYYNSKGSLDNF